MARSKRDEIEQELGLTRETRHLGAPFRAPGQWTSISVGLEPLVWTPKLRGRPSFILSFLQVLFQAFLSSNSLALHVYHPEKQPIAQPVNEARKEAEDHDVISILTSKLNKLRKGPVEMWWELRTFGLECHVPLYINFDDAYEIIGGEKMLSISCIQLWCMYMDTIVVESGWASIYGFQPETIQPSGNTLDSRKSYIQTWMTESNREIYIAPYSDAGHWQLMVIIPKKAQVVWFCSLHRKIKAELKSLIQTVVTSTRGQQLEIIYPKVGIR
ncbi:hypothetical protein LR48_Vigan04g092000 [Vigna angularis]|uniref:Ubiquitin-like protease family profile domain-containing protein n=1 Tax=Phaseolus angularis TaxID=3914 RepID=A0A0L9UDV4_PHAAN|nr:hypothetical protein LR48_Vigan04g092000 [Vigna angularis]